MSSIDKSKASGRRTSPSVTSPADTCLTLLQVPAFASSSISINNSPESSTSRRRRRSSGHPDRHVSAKHVNCDSLVASSSSTRFRDIHEPRKLDWKLELARNSSTTLLPSRSVSPAMSTFRSFDDFQRASAESDAPVAYNQSRESSFVYPIHQPGERIARRTQMLRARIATIIQSLPATVDDVVDAPGPSTPIIPLAEHVEQHDVSFGSRSSVDLSKKLRRVSGFVNLRDNFRRSISVGRDTPDKLAAAQGEHRLFRSSCPRPGSPALSSVDTLVEAPAPSFPTKQEKIEYKAVCPTISYPPKTPSEPFSTPPSTSPTRRDIRTRKEAHSASLSSPRRSGPKEQFSRRETCDEFGLVYIGGPVWSCAKITRSAAKRAARRTTPTKKNGLISYPLIHVFAHSLSA